MTKVKQVQEASKDGFRHLKNGSVHKKKQRKFKNTPTGKVALINGSQQKPNISPKQQNGKNLPKPIKSPKDPKSSQSPKNLNISKKSPQPKPKIEVEEDDDDSSSEDINEGILIKEEVSAPEDEVDDDSSSSEDGAVPDIFGTSLAEETDEDDDEFNADSDEEKEEATENKGVKMFKGLKVKAQPEESSSDEDEEEDEKDDDDSSDDDSSDGDVKPSLALKDLLGDSIADESDDESFQAEEESGEDEDSEEEVEDPEEEVDQSVNSSATIDEDDEEEEEESSDDDDDSSPDLTALLGTSIADDSDDEDFEGNEDDEDEEMSDDDEDKDTPSPSKKMKAVKTEDSEEEDEDGEKNESFDSTNAKSEEDEAEKPRIMTKAEKEESDKRTIFIGNVPKETEMSRIKSVFKRFGTIESIRFRGIVPKNPKVPLKVAAIKREFHPKSKTICVFVVYKNAESVEKALAMNGKKLDGNYLRVDYANQSRPVKDKKRTVFLGNLPFTIEDNEIWEAFKGCGRIESVRIIRDAKTGVSRGFGYINFETEDGAVLAMDMNGTTIKNRELRVKVNTPEGKRKQRQEKRQKRHFAENAETGSLKKQKISESSESVEVATHNSVNAERRTEKKKRSQGEKQRIKTESTSPQGRGAEQFQGQKADSKKKSKPDKSAKKKKQMAAKLLAKPKKPAAN